MNRLSQLLLILVFSAWMIFWLWAFTFQYSLSFFQHHLATRIPITSIALLAVAVAPLSAYRAIGHTIRRKSGPISSICWHLLVSGAPVGLFWGVTFLWVILSRRAGKLAFEADEAMGYGINFMLCFWVFLTSNLIVVCTVAAWKFNDWRNRMCSK